MRRFDLVAFDVDGTLVIHPEGKTVWEVLNRRFTGEDGSGDDRWADYRAGRLSYADWVALDIEGWRAAGASREDLIGAFEPLRLIDGAREAFDTLQDQGLRLVVISGTLDLLLHTLLEDSPFQEVHANHIAFDAQGRIAHWKATPFDMQGKAVALRAIALREGIPLERCAFVGDSGNDVWVAETAGYAIALNPKDEALEKVADAVVRSDDLRDILPYLLP